MTESPTDNLESLRADAQRTAEVCFQTSCHLVERADCLERRRRFWRIFEVIAAGLGIFTQTSTATQFFRGELSWVPLFVAIICFLALLVSSLYQANVVSDTPERIRDHNHYIYYYAEALNFYLEHRKYDARLDQIGRFEELLRLAHKNIDDARQKWSWAVYACPERGASRNVRSSPIRSRSTLVAVGNCNRS
jgi:hypothetical protein